MEFLRVLVGLLVVFGLLGALHYFSKRLDRIRLAKFLDRMPAVRRSPGMTKPASSEILRVFQRKSLTASHQVHVLGFGDEELLVCTHPQGCTLLSNRKGAMAEFSRQRLAEETGESRLAH